jgi:hypothetical protein
MGQTERKIVLGESGMIGSAQWCEQEIRAGLTSEMGALGNLEKSPGFSIL